MSSDSVSIGTANYPQLVDGVRIAEEPLTKAQAEDLTRSIRDAAEVIWVLIARAHAGKAWKALGYDSWAEYVREEFNMSRSRSYQLLDQAKVIEAVNAAIPDGAEVTVSESSARELKYVIQEAVPEIKEKTKGLEPAEAVRVTQEILAKYQAKQDSEKEPEEPETVEGKVVDSTLVYSTESEVPPAVDEESPSSAEAPEDTESNASPTSEVAPPAPVTPPPPAIDPENLAKIRKNVNAAHDIYSALAALSSLPEELDEVIEIIPKERRTVITSNLETAMENLRTFQAIWSDLVTQDDKEAK